MSDGFTVVDTETTGPDPETARIIQVGWAGFTGLELVDTGSRLVGLPPGVTVPMGAYQVHGVSTADVQGLPEFRAVWPPTELDECLVTYNGLHFDVPVLECEAKLSGGLDLRLPMDHLDVYVFVAWHWRGRRSRKLSDIAAALGIRAEGALHTADVDCEVTGRILAKLVTLGIVPDDLAEARARHDLLRAALAEEDGQWRNWVYRDRVTGVLRMGAGRHVGKLLADVPGSEWTWARDKVHDVPDRVRDLFTRMSPHVEPQKPPEQSPVLGPGAQDARPAVNGDGCGHGIEWDP